MKKFGFNFSHFRGDLFGGLTAGIVALPLALAFGVQSGLGGAAGLYGAIFISFFAALFGGTATQISGPTAPMTAVSMVAIGTILSINNGDMSLALPTILILFLFAGLIQILLGLLKVGVYIRYIPYPVVSGFMTGIGIIILLTQLLPLLGYYPKEDIEFVEKFKPEAKEILLRKILEEEVSDQTLDAEDLQITLNRAVELQDADILREAKNLASKKSSGVMGFFNVANNAIKNIHGFELLLGLLTILIIYGFKFITKKIPSTLVALLLVTAIANLLIKDYKTIGEIPSGFPQFRLDIFSSFQLSSLLPFVATSFSLAILGAIDSLLTSVVADNKTKTKHSPNQELMGQGIGNMAAALFGGIPGAGATIRTVVNIDAGGKTKLSGMLAGVFLLLILLLLGPLASTIPAAVLAGILITVGIGVMDYKGLKAVTQIPISEVLVMITVILLTVFVGLIEAVVVGLILASILFMKNISDVVDKRTKAAPLQKFSAEIPWLDEGNIQEEYKERVYIKHLDGPLFFGFASRFQDLINAIPSIRIFAIRMDKVPYIDQSGVYALEEAIMGLQKQNVKIVFIGLHGQGLDMCERINLIPSLVSRENCFNDFASFSDWLKNYLHSDELK